MASNVQSRKICPDKQQGKRKKEALDRLQRHCVRRERDKESRFICNTKDWISGQFTR